MNLPQESKILIYQAIRNFTSEEIDEIEQSLDSFMSDWNAHGAELTAAYALPYDRFIVIAVDETLVKTSGCSVDSLTQFIKGIEAKFNLGLLNNMMVSYSINNEIFTIPLNEFKQKVKQDEIPQHASVFHNGVKTLSDFEESWELPLSESWVNVLLNK
ncbi:MAG: ABC transporter ATPase [Weeksellaceae bacterium]|jgi:hypothetical protein|nr:ABC transporter ATPase [Weeksellaceae bacterium]MDX9704101.1 ABC transporter ATPase [Weeksellaceae bacterium]